VITKLQNYQGSKFGRIWMMRFDIDQQTIKQAKGCPFNRRCLEDSGGSKLCDATQYVKDGLCVACSDWSEKCGFRKASDYVFVCTCPIRKEIYRKYKS
jgi:hypothetical protein